MDRNLAEVAVWSWSASAGHLKNMTNSRYGSIAIKATTNNNYWTTRLLQDGTPYSYRPPMAAGKMLYCCDRGYGYRWGTESFLNSYTYTSATGADADTVFKTALAQSGLGELDAQELENAKWMMTYIVDYKGEIPGSLFMALQTYIWDHQTFKGNGDGDIDVNDIEKGQQINND